MGQGRRQEQKGKLALFSYLDLGPAASITMGQIGKRKKKTNHTDDPGRTVLNNFLSSLFFFIFFTLSS